MARPRTFETDAVVERAMQAFWTLGYANTSPAALAEATGVAKGSLYNAFGSKRELFVLALERYDRLGAEFAAELLARPGTTRECLRAFLHDSVQSDLTHPVRRGCLAVNTAVELSGHDPEIARAVRRAVERTMAALESRITQGIRDGDVPLDLDPRATAEYLMNTIAGLRVMARSYDAATLLRIADTALTVLGPA
ncbi:TetR family transcriptional regulator [Streptomyces sp. 1114.5]|uniref:TetR/AcrR family transcriptional regulator n=1 Tax=unclassified Streptomyces TaxID=2593676 RepID=UPI000BD20E7E|nr:MULTISPECIES: TetR/AcrR family transcriptional regulator [unclassified Streptomyces]RKT18612.1 TetR family transcriptional regulator [Streptomyces sp. 1114.5]SOB84814.1 transcriptional regulator, TetR family [Streptomyces sp. 1331.2]